MKNSNQVFTVYTTSDFPYGGAPENFVRQMVYGLDVNRAKVNVVLLRGHYAEPTANNSRIVCFNLLFKRRVRNEIFKFVELFLIIIAIPVSVVKNRLKNKTKVIILYGIEYFYLVIPFLIVGKILGIKVYRVITDRYTDRGIAPTWWKIPKLFFYQLQYKFFDRYLSGVICLSHYLFKNAINNGVKKKRACIIPHFIDIEKFTAAINEGPFNKKNVRIGMCGTLTRENGLLVLLDAFIYLKNQNAPIELFLIGPIPQQDSSVVNEKLFGIEESVILMGKVSGERVPELLSTCDILVNPRISGTFAEAGFPTKLGEYLATKRPVVATSVGDIRTYFTDKTELVMVKPNSSESLAEGIMYLIKNTELALQIGINGFEWASANVDYKKSAVQLVKFISNS